MARFQLALTREQGRTQIAHVPSGSHHRPQVVWIERTYHRKRRQRRLGKLTPIEFETIKVALKAA